MRQYCARVVFATVLADGLAAAVVQVVCPREGVLGAPGEWFRFRCSSNCCGPGRSRCSGPWRRCRSCCGRWCRLLFYSAPPGQLPLVLAIGHEFQLGTDFGPPLAFWLAELAYRAAGMFGVYLLSQVCIVVTFWAVLSARPARGRRNPRRDGGAADGGRRGVLGADARVRPGHSRNAALGDAAVSLLARRAPRRLHLLARRRHRSRAAAAHDLWRTDPDRSRRAVHAVEPGRPLASGERGALDRGSRHRRHPVSLPDLARSRRRHQADRSCAGDAEPPHVGLDAGCPAGRAISASASWSCSGAAISFLRAASRRR